MVSSASEIQRKIEEVKERIAKIRERIEARRTTPGRHSTMPKSRPPKNPALTR